MPIVKKAIVTKNPKNDRINVSMDKPFHDAGTHIELKSQELCSKCLSYKVVIPIDTGIHLEIPPGCCAVIAPSKEFMERGVRFSTQFIHDSGPVVVPVELKTGAYQTEIAPGDAFCCLYVLSLVPVEFQEGE